MGSKGIQFLRPSATLNLSNEIAENDSRKAEVLPSTLSQKDHQIVDISDLIGESKEHIRKQNLRNTPTSYTPIIPTSSSSSSSAQASLRQIYLDLYSGMSSEQLRREASQLTVTLDSRLASFEEKLEATSSSMSSTQTPSIAPSLALSSPPTHNSKTTPSPSSTTPTTTSILSGMTLELELEIEVLLSKLSTVIERLNRFEETNQLNQKKNKSFELKLHQFTHSFSKTKSKSRKVIEREKLFSQTAMEATRKDAKEILQHEGSTLKNTIHSMDTLLEQAKNAHSTLVNQKEQILTTFGRLSAIQDFLPQVGEILTSIKNKQRKDLVVLAGVIATCLLALFFYWWNIVLAPSSSPTGEGLGISGTSLSSPPNTK